ncbi:MAG TPA: GDSL-type esterase/lipase family protein [candidate division Zixibacteria bacterium]|mgnify:FL=1|nr:GDSL-type esterase/lipase family protein [candidate division Zixibacteria bacterium]
MKPLCALVLLAALGVSAGAAPDPADSRPSDSVLTVAVLGSSVAAGWVTSFQTRYDMENGWAARLGRALDPRRYRLVNLSVPGDNTAKALARFDGDVLPADPDFLIIALSLSNEGLETLDPDSVCAAFETGLLSLVARCRDRGIQPILASCYPNSGFSEAQYAYLQRTNLQLYAWNLPGLNLLGALDDGRGRLLDGYTYDEGHPDDLGHEELSLSIVPTIFDALREGKEAVTEFSGERYVTVGTADSPLPLSWVPSHPVHSFTFAFQVRTDGPGAIAAITSRTHAASLAIDGDGRVIWSGGDGAAIVSAGAAPGR